MQLPPYTPRTDPRDLKAGWFVSDRNGYYDSQNIVAVTEADGSLGLSVIFHHSENREGGPGLRLLSTHSTDRGRTWSMPTPVDDPVRQSHDGYQLLQRMPDGSERIFVFYGWNAGSQYPPGADPSWTELRRTDMQLDEGYWFRVSHDGGRTWGDRRWSVPVRRTRIDRENPWGGDTMGMFLCDKPSVIGGAVYMAFQKTREGAGETPGSEVFFLRSPNLLHVDDLDDAEWQTLPLGDVGLQSPDGELQLGEEPHVLQPVDVLPQRLFSLWRAETGKLAAAHSDDGGQQWHDPFWLTYEGVPEGQVMKNPRGSITPYRMHAPAPDGSAEFVLVFYNNGRTERLGYVGRRVYWLTVGRGTPQGTIRWAQPELLLYWDGSGFEDRPDWNADWAIVDGPGYPDWVELPDGTLALVESNKLAVRYHEVEARLLQHLRHQPELRHLPVEALALHWAAGQPVPSACPVLADLRAGGGCTLTVAFRATAPEVAGGRTLVQAFSNVTAALGEEPTHRRIDKGYRISVTPQGELELFLTDGFDTHHRHCTCIATDLGCWDGEEHTVSFVLDGAAKVSSVVVDERLDDGGATQPQGWHFLPRTMGEVGGHDLQLSDDGVLCDFLVHDRALLTSETIAASRFLRG
ncbi:MAG: sialidase family protein [Actinomycetota bacterium]